MSIKKLARAEITAVAATYYTVPASQFAQITAATLTNKTAAPVTATIYIVDSGGSTADANALIVESLSVPANDVVGVPELIGQVLEPGETIQALAASGSAITLFVSGDQKAG